jgi:FtsP/CotA-like multicopper oxidase with cupredoxin domain
VLSDWTDEDPQTVLGNLKQQSDFYNFHQRTVGTFMRDAQTKGLGATISDRLMWNGMNMSPTDILDVSGATYTGCQSFVRRPSIEDEVFGLGRTACWSESNSNSRATKP